MVSEGAGEPLDGPAMAGDAPPDRPAMAGADWLADRLTEADTPAWQRLEAALSRMGAVPRVEAALRQLGAVDRAVYEAIASVPTPTLDEPLRRLSQAADKSRLWLAIAAVIALTGGPTGRRAALRGVLSIGVTSAVVNLGAKSLYARRRPDRAGAGVPGERYVTMPGSTSFPSGHSASATAFASAVGRDLPGLALGLHMLAAAVAYSRVHTGVHYPGDTVVGAVIGASTATLVGGVMDRYVTTTGPLRYLHGSET
ncbi:MAG TPA: phosphatase PAP2 family protein [Streptosporangiaceae bacterium]|nr:phosphatase PAP2 family protein [Streptosporangiaceae bacterium]